MTAPASDTDVRSATWRSLGTGVRLVVHGLDLAPARHAVEALLDDIDRTYSRFRPDSELVRLNDRAGASVSVSPLLAEAIDVAMRAARETDGAVDPTVGRAMRAIGYDRDFAALADRTGPIDLRLEPIPGWETVDVSRPRREVRLRPGVELDLGSTGKALAADLAAAAALATADGDPATRPGVLVSLGGDIAMVGAAPDGGWRILIAENSETPPDGEGETIALDGGALATSSTTVRRWRRGTVSLHHLVDPRTGGPADSPWRTVTVAAPTCIDANTAATAAIVLGVDGLAWLNTVDHPARLVSVDGEIVRINGWPSPIATDERSRP